ncbi:MAG: MCP four helix bundle domain-containing protein, partial [Pyrinomonadaceae bacterium]
MIRNLKIGLRLFMLLGFIFLLTVLVGVLGLWGMSRANFGMESIYKDRVVPLKQLKTIADMYAVNIVDTTHKLRNGNISWAEGQKNVDEATKVIDEQWQAYLSTVLVPEEEKLVKQAK